MIALLNTLQKEEWNMDQTRLMDIEELQHHLGLTRNAVHLPLPPNPFPPQEAETVFSQSTTNWPSRSKIKQS